MANSGDDISVGRQLMCGAGQPPWMGIGAAAVRGAAFVEGPLSIGNATEFPGAYATLMVGPLSNGDAIKIPIAGANCGQNFSPYSLVVSGDAAIFDNLSVSSKVIAGSDIIAQGEVKSRCGAHILSAKKNFDIPHPSKEGWRLRHTCPEGPSNDVYFRGRVTNRTEIEFPTYWKNFVDTQSVTVSLTPIGSHQDVIVKRIDEKKVYLQSKGGMTIDCYYHIYGTRTDGDTLVAEYPGLTPDDYPGDNREYNINK